MRNDSRIVWFFYLTFLWVFSWPILWLITDCYEVVELEYPYTYLESGSKPVSGLKLMERLRSVGTKDRKPIAQSESMFFTVWKNSIQRAIQEGHRGFINGQFRANTEDRMQLEPPSTKGPLNGIVEAFNNLAKTLEGVLN